jgi:serine/threonine protein kinase
MSPQVLKHRQYTSKTDVWSLGVLFFELAFGRLPYTGYSEEDLYKNIAKGPLQIPECSKEAAELLQKCLAIEEEDRWGWPEVLEALFGKYNGQKPRGSIPKNGIFYRDEPSTPKVNPSPILKPEVIPRMAVNNYLQEVGQEQPQSDRMKS